MRALVLIVVVVLAAGCGGSGGSGGRTASQDGKAIFVEKGCGFCHTLAAAGASSTVATNLDESKPSLELVRDRVTNGRAAMPSYANQLSARQIQELAAFIVKATGGG
jgi:mono/diheme cytochrome c family protein